VKKKYSATLKDKEDWLNYIEQIKSIPEKTFNFKEKIFNKNKVKRLDLHGFSLDEANIEVKNFINKSYENGLSKILIIVGKGKRSKISNDPYRSLKMNVLKYSVPEYLKKSKDLSSKIKKISKADLKDGGEGALYVFLKSINKTTE
jgi:DNA-nicking Smr family endonuclease